jgi:hypothetical protein
MKPPGWSLISLLALAVAGCQSGSTGAPTGSAATVSRTVTAAPQSSAPLPNVTFSCKLPISDGTAGSGGFISFPGAQFAADPSSQVAVPGPGAGGRKAFGLSYDRGFHRWLPVPYSWVSPDGTRYAYPAPNAIEMVDVASNSIIREVGKDIGGWWWPVDFENGGLYGYQVADSAADPPVQGGFQLWVFPNGQPQHQPPQYAYGDVIAIVGSLDYTAGQLGGPDSAITTALFRQDLRQGGASMIFNPGSDPSGSNVTPYMWVGGVSDTAFVLLNRGDLIELSGPQPSPIKIGLGGDLPRTGYKSYSIVQDAHGIWIAGQHGLYLLTAQGVLYAGGHTGNLGGTCI